MCNSGCNHESQAQPVSESFDVVEQAICHECGAAHLPDDGVLACDHQFCSVDCAVEGGFLMVDGEWHDCTQFEGDWYLDEDQNTKNGH